MNIVHHYPPELMALLIDAIPRLLKGKKDVLGFFHGAGVASSTYADIATTIRDTPNTITKFEIVRQILGRLNDMGEPGLRPRREVLRRVTQWEDFTACWDNDRMAAKGYVAEIRKLVEVKDAFTRMDQERERERAQHLEARRAEDAERQRVKAERAQVKTDLYALFNEADASKRGTALEGVLNRLFRSHGILLRESFKLLGSCGEGVVEQIDGVIEVDGNVYLVELKWRSQPLGVAEVSQHLVRVHGRAAARGILISQSGYTAPAITTCREALARSVFVLVKLEELVLLLEREGLLVDLLREKVRSAIVDRNPLFEPTKAP